MLGNLELEPFLLPHRLRMKCLACNGSSYPKWIWYKLSIFCFGSHLVHLVYVSFTYKCLAYSSDQTLIFVKKSGFVFSWSGVWTLNWWTGYWSFNLWILCKFNLHFLIKFYFYLFSSALRKNVWLNSSNESSYLWKSILTLLWVIRKSNQIKLEWFSALQCGFEQS